MELGACVVKALQEFVIIINENDEFKFKCMNVLIIKFWSNWLLK